MTEIHVCRTYGPPFGDMIEPPAKWYAIHPETGQQTLIYRSYRDYVDD